MNSKLATYTNITPNNSGPRTSRITKITPHYMAAAWSGRQCADYFVNCAAQGRQASSNYCIGTAGDIAVSVPEDCRAWTSASEWNDQRAVTIECGNNPDSSLPDACYTALVALCADICTRHGIDPHYDGTIYGTITMHKQFASTDCPGSWLSKKITSGQFEKDIKEAMKGQTSDQKPAALYKVRKGVDDAKSQIGAYRDRSNAIRACKKGYGVYQDGRTVYQHRADGRWDRDAVVMKGDTVKSVLCDSTGIQGDLVGIPKLGGLVPLADLEKSGKQYRLKSCKITDVSPSENLVQVNGYWVKADPLLKKVG